MTIERLTMDKVDVVAPLVAEFRMTLMSYKGIQVQRDIEDGKEELLDYLNILRNQTREYLIWLWKKLDRYRKKSGILEINMNVI